MRLIPSFISRMKVILSSGGFLLLTQISWAQTDVLDGSYNALLPRLTGSQAALTIKSDGQLLTDWRFRERLKSFYFLRVDPNSGDSLQVQADGAGVAVEDGSAIADTVRTITRRDRWSFQVNLSGGKRVFGLKGETRDFISPSTGVRLTRALETATPATASLKKFLPGLTKKGFEYLLVDQWSLGFDIGYLNRRVLDTLDLADNDYDPYPFVAIELDWLGLVKEFFDPDSKGWQNVGLSVGARVTYGTPVDELLGYTSARVVGDTLVGVGKTPAGLLGPAEDAGAGLTVNGAVLWYLFERLVASGYSTCAFREGASPRVRSGFSLSLLAASVIQDDKFKLPSAIGLGVERNHEKESGTWSVFITGSIAFN